MRRILLTLVLLTVARGAMAATVNVSTIAVAGGVVTVTTASAHGIAANAGFCITNTSACSTAATVPTSTTLTFTQPSNVTVAVCASSCGTISTAPQVIILDVSQPNQSVKSLRYLLWLTTTAPVPRSGFVSAWIPGAGSNGASTAQTNALTAGNFIERQQSETFPSTMTAAQIQTFLQQSYTTQQAALAANTQPGQFYGSVWDGAAWSVQ